MSTDIERDAEDISYAEAHFNFDWSDGRLAALRTKLGSAIDNADESAGEWQRGVSDYEVHEWDAAYVSMIFGAFNNGCDLVNEDTGQPVEPMTIEDAAKLGQAAEAARKVWQDGEA